MVDDVNKEILEIVDLAITEKAKQPIKVKKPTLPEKPKEVPIVVEKKKREMRGRPKGSSDNKPTKIKLKPTPKSAVLAFKEEFKGLPIVAIYGVDEFTEELIKTLWSNPNISFAVTDPIPQHSANLTRSIGSLPYSIYRYSQFHHNGFIEQGRYPVIVVSDKYWDAVNKLPNPNKVIFTCLSHWGK